MSKDQFIEIIQKYYGNIKEIIWEDQNKNYLGCIVKLDEQIHRVRVAKITPKKIGQFVAIWQKDEHNVNQAFSFDDSPEYLSIFVFDGDKKGVFIFPKETMKNKGVYTTY